MCERLAKAGHFKGRDLPRRWHPFGQYSLVKEIVLMRDSIDSCSQPTTGTEERR